MTYSSETLVNERLNAIVAFHIMAKPNLNDFMLRDRRSNCIKDIIQSQHPNILEVLA